jgi:hypothetical protein
MLIVHNDEKLIASELRIDSMPTANKRVAKAVGPCFADALVKGGSSILQMKFSTKNSRHRKPSNDISNS